MIMKYWDWLIVLENNEALGKMLTEPHSTREIESLPLLANEENGIQDPDNVEAELTTAHQIGRDSWFQVSFLQITGLNCAYVLGFSGTIMKHLGWIGGVVGFLVATVLSLDANILIAKLHSVGGKRHIRYRDLAGHIYGRKGYLTVWALQYVNLFLTNIGFIILAGSALKAVYDLFSDDNAMKLSYCNLIAGFACFIFAVSIPHLSALKVWLGVSTVLILVYIIVAILLSIRDGIKAPARDYSISGTLTKRIFTTIGSTADLFVTLNNGMIPEIQATIREPAVRNMIKSLVSMFTVGIVPMYAVVFVGYWAYGSSVSTYLLDNTTGPLWLKALANICAFFQAVISFHIFASPSYEYFDTKYGTKGSVLEIRNLSFRIGLRGSYVFSSSLLSALLPFFGDFMGLTGAVCTLPLAFVIPHHMYLATKKNKLYFLQRLWHWLNVYIFGCFSIIATIAAVRLIVVDSKNYHLFGS